MTSFRDVLELLERPTLRWIGLMSGTSGDGIDVAWVEIEEVPEIGAARVSVVKGFTRPFPAGVGERLLRDLSAGPLDVEEAARWDVRLGALFGEAAREARERWGADAIALAGHTFAHLPGETPRSTLQLGSPGVVAERAGLPVISGFRSADVARGGEGAPLVPVGDRVLFADPVARVVVANLGGIANLTGLPRRGDPRALDTGPCNLVLNEIVRRGSEGRHPYDPDGGMAMRGRCHHGLVERWMEHPFFRGEIRSTGREEFGEAWVESHDADLAPLCVEDRLATAVEWIAAALDRGLRRLAVAPDRVLVGGGGAHNRALMQGLERVLPVTPEILDRARHRVDADLREAAAFGILGHESLHGRPGSYPGTTGCRVAGPLGSLTPGP